jgi:O-antigen/teichoic acid export membrane protein
MFSIAARLFNVAQFGLLSFFITITIVVYTALDFGHRLMVVRDISADSAKISSDYLRNKVWLKLLSFLFFAALLFGYALWKDFWQYHKIVTVFLLVTGLAKGMVNLYFAVFQGLTLFKNETKSLGLFTACTIVTLGACYLRPSIAVFILGYTISALAQLVYTHYLAVRTIPNFGISTMIGGFDGSALLKELRLGLVFAGIVLVEIAFSSFDSFFVENQYLPEDLGYYEAFKKLFLGLNVFAMVLAVAFFPEVSKRLKTNMTEGIPFVWKAFGVLSVTGLAVVSTYIIFNDQVIYLVLGDQFAVLSTWDTHLALITLASYLRVAPNLYFVGSSQEKYRFLLSGIFMVVEVVLFLTLLGQSSDVRQAIKMLTYVHLAFTSVAIIVGLTLSVIQHNTLRKIRI